MQTVSTDFEDAVAAPYKEVAAGALIAWQKTINPTYQFFEIGVSEIGGPDMIKGAGGTITFFDKYQYDNETQNVESFKVTRTQSSLPWGVIMAQAEITLLNASNRFTPQVDPTIGDYIKPDRPIKLSVGINGEYVNVFTGYTERPISNIGTRRTTLRAWDALKYLSNKKSDLPVFVDTPANEIIEALLDEQGFDSSQYVIEASLQRPIGYLMVQDRVVTEIFKDLVAAEGAFMFCDENGIIHFWNRLHLNSNSTSRWNFDYSNLTGIEWDTTPIVNDAIVTAKPFRQVAFNKLWESGQVYTVPPGGSLDVFADFRDDVGNYPAISVVTPVNIASAVSSSYQTNYNEDGTGSDAAGAISLSSVYLFGERYRMTYANSSDQNVYLTKIQLYGIPAKVQVIDSKEQTDATSIEDYGINPDNNGEIVEVNNNLVQDAATANALAYIYVQLFKGPLQRLKCSTFAVPHLQVGDYVTVDEETSGNVLDMTIVGLDISLAKNGDLKQNFTFEERAVYNYFTIGISEIGGSDYLAP
jgi:hypothetical protein